MLVDAMTTRMVLKPGSIDTVVATNLHADVLSDLAAALTGSLGLAPTANLNPEGDYPSMFEPIHGSAEHLGEAGAASALIAAIEQVTGAGRVRPRDLGGEATTAEVTEAVIAAIDGANA
jgi:tartrate dehydrogenase/decarboxylase/D-malate dehydrogenase